MAPLRRSATVIGPDIQIDPSHNIWRQRRQPLDAIFRPKSVALIGASDKPCSVGRTLLSNLISQPFGGTVFPVNPHAKNVLGIQAYKTIALVPETPDLAVIATPAATVPGIVKECVEAGVQSAVIISAGFKELGEPGQRLEEEILNYAQGKMRIVGPNCLGVMTPPAGFNATFASRLARPGSVAFISQSGALCTAILDWSFEAQVGFSAFVSIGSMLDVGWGDLIDYLGDDEKTRSILIYMETIGDARSFLSAAREVALTKPIIVLKAGRTEAAAKAAASHTGSIAGSDKALDAAFDRSGVLRVDSIEELFDMADVLAKQPRPSGSKLAIVTNAGGPGVLTTDTLIAEGGSLAALSRETVQSLNQALPPHWSHANPVDILGDATPGRYGQTVEAVSKDPAVNGVLVLLTPQAMTDPTKTAEILAACSRTERKPLLASWMGGEEIQRGRAILKRAGIPVFDYPDRAARIFNRMWKYSYNLECLYRTPTVADDDAAPDEETCEDLLASAIKEKRNILSETESKKLLASYGVPVVESRVARSQEEAVKLAEAVGYPVVLKLHSETLTHKTDVGGVQLDLGGARAVKEAFRRIQDSVSKKAGAGHFAGVSVQKMVKAAGVELILGSAHDEQLGPVILFGAGGQLVEILNDHRLALPPLNSTLARRLIEQTKVYRLLQGTRGRPSVDFAALEKILVRFSRLVAEHRLVREIEINPLLASPEGLISLDARVVLHPVRTLKKNIPPLAIRPYPEEYVWEWRSANGLLFKIRPIRPEDEPLVVKFHHTLSEESVRRRYFGPLKLDTRIAHERLVRVCYNDYDRDIALVVEHRGGSGEPEILGVGRLSRLHDNQAEFSMIISDQAQNQGLGTELLKLLIETARREKIACLKAEILSDNRVMQHLCQKTGFELKFEQEGGNVTAFLPLGPRKNPRRNGCQ